MSDVDEQDLGYDPAQVNRAVKLLQLEQEKRKGGSLYRALALQKKLEEIPDEIWTVASQVMAADDKYAETGVPIRRGRRADLREAAAASGQNPLMIKVSIAGSAYGKWFTHEEQEGEGEPLGWDKISSSVTCYRRDVGKGPELMFAGPGGKGTTGAGSWGFGALDRGSNSISNLVAEVPKQVASIINYDRVANGNRPIIILIRGHSRGAVAADQAANVLRSTYPDAKIELTVIDPVPGPNQDDAALKTDVGKIDESTIVYSVASGKLVTGFWPQQVTGTKRIIVSQQDHSTSLAQGFIYEGRRYKGSSMNSLPEGVYVDRNETGESTVPLKLIASIAQLDDRLNDAFAEARGRLDYDAEKRRMLAGAVAQSDRAAKDAQNAAAAAGRTTDRGRMEIIHNVLKEYFEGAR